MDKATTTANLNADVIAEAIQISGGIYRMNAKHAVGYAFCVNEDNPSDICMGMFVHFSSAATYDQFDGFLSFKHKTVTDLHTGESISI